MTARAAARALLDRTGAHLVVDDPHLLMEVIALIERLNRSRLRNGLLPLEHASAFVAPAREALALARVAQKQPLSTGERVLGGQWIPTADAAERLGITTQAITKRARAGTIQARKIAGTWWIHLEETR